MEHFEIDSSTVNTDNNANYSSNSGHGDADAVNEPPDLKKALHWYDLVGIGVGGTIGAGIFVVTGVVANEKTGPALFLSYIFAGFACLLSAFAYAEFAAMAPSAGSAYTYAHGTLGELMGWIIGWDLILEYAVASASVAQSFSHYFQAIFTLCGVNIPDQISKPPWGFDAVSGSVTSSDGVFDLIAILITMICTGFCVRGIKESSRFANVMVVIKVLIVIFVIVAGLAFVDSKNMTPFMPYGFFSLSFFGYTVTGQSAPDGSPVGVLAGSAIVFFAYIGFDAVSCQAEESINPQRDLPIGIVGSLVLSTVLYIAVSLVLVGMVPYTSINTDAPISSAFGSRGLFWAELIVAFGAVIGIVSVLVVNLIAQPRILLAMSRDGLLPQSTFGAIHSKYGTPWIGSLITGGVVSALAGLIPLTVLVELVSIGTLLAFTLVNLSVIILRRLSPDAPRPFKCPYVPYVPAVGAATCIMLMISLPSANWIRLIVWLAIGLAIYYLWGRQNAQKQRLTRTTEQEQEQENNSNKNQIEINNNSSDDTEHHDFEEVGESESENVFDKDQSGAGAGAVDNSDDDALLRNEFMTAGSNLSVGDYGDDGQNSHEYE